MSPDHTRPRANESGTDRFSVRATLDRIDDRVNRFPWAAGILGGTITFLASYVAFFATVLVAARGVTLDDPVLVAREIGSLFYASLFVERRIQTPDGQVVEQVNLLFVQQSQTPIEVYFLVPIVVLVIASIVFARLFITVDPAAGTRGIATRSLNGAIAITVGYLLVALVGTFLLAQQATGQYTLEAFPDRIQTLAMATAYPAILVGIGTAVDQYVRLRSSEDRPGDGASRTDAPE